MAYDVTKRIKGRDYLYHVEGYRDPETRQRKTRWQYVGPVANGEMQLAVRRRSETVTREEIIAATARLMEHRDPSHVTVSVIVSQAKTSHSTFYRQFRDRNTVVNAALVRICDKLMEGLPQLDAPLTSVDEARQRLRQWFGALFSSALQQRALRWALSQGEPGKLRARIQRSLLRVDAVALLVNFFKEIDDAGFAIIEDPVSLARTIRDTQEALLLAVIAQSKELDAARPRFADVFPVIERAVFGERAPAAIREEPRHRQQSRDQFE